MATVSIPAAIAQIQGRLQSIMDAYAKDKYDEWRRAHIDVGATVSTQAKKNAPVRTGVMRASIRYKLDSKVLGQTHGVQVASEKPYSLYVEEGTRPHTIRIKNKAWLAVYVMSQAYGKGTIMKRFRPLVDKMRERAIARGMSPQQAVKSIPNKKGYVVFGKKVNHPGTKPNAFFSRAVEETKPYVLERYKKAGWENIKIAVRSIREQA